MFYGIKDSSKYGFSRQDAKAAKGNPKEFFKSFSLRSWRLCVILLAFNYVFFIDFDVTLSME
jgi:hypothetical protein